MMRSLRVMTALLVALESLVMRETALADHSSTDCYATLSGTELCAVNYTSSLVLHCPVNSSSTSSSSEPSYGGGEWWRENPLTGELSGICHNSVCTISEPLSNQDSGLYFCQENNKTYPVHITILAPPSIECDPRSCRCNELTNVCLLPMISKPFDADIQLTTRFKGQGPLKVTWEHKGKEIDCNSTLDEQDQKCTIVRGRSSDYEFETLTLSAPHYVDRDSGIYSANVSNPYGYNMTEEYVRIEYNCIQNEPPDKVANSSISIAEGGRHKVTLTTHGDSIHYMWICYTTNPSVNMWNINLTKSCVKCRNRMTGNCSALPNRPHWMVFRNQTGCPANSLLQLSVFVEDFNERDVGRLMLSWSTDDMNTDPNRHEVLTMTSLHLKPSDTISRYIYAGIGAGGLCLVIVVVVVSSVAGVVAYKRKKRAANRVRRRAERRHEAQNRERGRRGHRGGATTTTDDEEQHLNRGGGGGRNYNAINNDTSEADDRVALVTDSDVNNVRDI